MTEIFMQHSFEYRQETVNRLFNWVHKIESGVVVGAAHIGKTNLIDFLMREDVLRRYMGEQAQRTLFVRVDSNIITGSSNLEFYELMLSSILTVCNNNPNFYNFREDLSTYDFEIIREKNELLGLRLLRLSVQKICKEHTVCFIFDEFDNLYQHLSSQAFDNLKGIIDTTSNSVLYIFFMRQFPEFLRDPSTNESFFECISNNMVGLEPYTRRDSLAVMNQLETRKRHPMTADQREWMYAASGGHPGLIKAVLSFVEDHPEFFHADWRQLIPLICQQDVVRDESIKIWKSLLEDERSCIIEFLQNGNISSPRIARRLLIKGIMRRGFNSELSVFSPIFHTFVSEEGKKSEQNKNIAYPGRIQTLLNTSLSVFLCHAVEDKQFVRELFEKMSLIRGIDPWFDETKLLPGEDWDYEVRNALQKADVVIVCLSQRSVKKEGYINKEIKQALDLADEKPEGTLFVLPLKLEECDIPVRLSKWHWLNYFDEKAFPKLMQSLQKRAVALGVNVNYEK